SGSLYEGLEDHPALVQERILDIAIQFARGLYYAHESRDDSGNPQKLIHRDVKPGNVLLSKSGEVKVSDFGLTKAVTQPLQGNPADGMKGSCFKGTPAYCSAEQMDEKPLTLQTDLYSWAVSVMEMYRGSHPWANGVVAGIGCRKYFEEAKVPVPSAMADLLERCLAARPDDRPRDFGLVIAELRAIYRMVTGKDYPREASQSAADTADSLNNRALSMLDLGKPEEAEKFWERALQLSQSHFDALFNSSLYRWRSGLLTDEDAYLRVQLGNSYYSESENGKKALSAFMTEAGKIACFEPLFADQAKHPVQKKREHSIDARVKTSVLWRGKLYLSVDVSQDAQRGRNRECALFIYDADSGDCLSKNYFENIQKEFGFVNDIALSPDAEVSIITTPDHFVYYDLLHARIEKAFPKGKPIMYSMYGPFSFRGKQHRYAYRMRSSGIGHGPPTTELWNFETGTMLDYTQETELMEADEVSIQQQLHIPYDNAIETPQLYLSCFTDGLRLIPSVSVDGRWYRCDRSGHPVFPMNDSIQAFKSDAGRIVLRIHGQSRLWMQDHRSIAEWNIQSGKHLRTYRIDARKNDIFIDEDGLGCVGIRKSEAEDQDEFWQYRVLPKIATENQAQWQLSKVESHQEIMRQEQLLQSLSAQFDRYCSFGDSAGTLRVFRESEGIPRFSGSAIQQHMTDMLDIMAGVRQVCIAALKTSSITLREDNSPSSFADLSLFGLANPALPPEVVKRIAHSGWILDDKSKIQNQNVSPDGKLLLICGQGDGPVGNSMQKIGSIRAPLGSGIYVLDVPSNEFYHLASFTPSYFRPSARFSKDMRYVVLDNASWNGIPGALAVFELSSGAVVCITPTDRARHSLHIQPNFEGYPAALIWVRGVFRFQTDTEYECFTALEGDQFQILDVDEKRGLILYSCSNTSAMDSTVYIWDVVQQKHVLEVLQPTNSSVSTAALRDDGRMVLLENHAGNKVKEYSLYQLGYSYELGERRYFFNSDENNTRLNLKKCEWPSASSAPAATSPPPIVAKPNTSPTATAPQHQSPKKRKTKLDAILEFFR
ncbi:MAG: protein kinase, partial [Christensenella sp.]|nr:protein kinase [Christensenella sp.]